MVSNIRFTCLLLFFYLLSSVQLQAQDHPCGTVTPEGYEPPHIANPAKFEEFKTKFLEDYNLREGKNGTSQRATGTCINSVPLAIWIIRTSSGTGGLTTGELNSAMATVNLRYAAACMEFYVCEINYIDNSTYYDFDMSEENALVASHWTNDAINVYFANSVGSGSSSYCGYANYPSVQQRNIVLMDNYCANNGSTFPHELGHSYSLPHTHNGGSELVNGSNCSTAGDRFCDTPADPNVSGQVTIACVYTGTSTDANGDTYVPDPTNIMSYSRKLCRTYFSPEQLAAISFSHFYAPDRDLSCSVFEADFEAVSATSCRPAHPVSFTNQSNGATSYDWDFDNNGTTDATTANPSYLFPTTGSYSVALEVSNGTTSVRKLLNNYVLVGSTPFPYTNSLSSFTPSEYAVGYNSGWEAKPSRGYREYQWNVATGPTPSPNTGPNGGYSASGGFTGTYVHVEASGARSAGDVTTLSTSCIDLLPLSIEPNPSFDFYYHMYGSSMGNLHVDVEVGGVWVNDIMTPINGQQQTSSSDAYLFKTIPISAYAGNVVRFRFRAEYGGTSYEGDIAIDEVSVVTSSVPLPVDLVSFTGAQYDNGAHHLAWSTATEQDADFFELQRAVDGTSFEAMTKVFAHGTSAEANDYSFTDFVPVSGANYYRLRMVDLDGSEEYSNTVVLSTKQDEKRIEVYPNPADESLTVLGTSTNDLVEIHNQLGQQMRSTQVSASNVRQNISISDLPAGLYALRVVSGTGEVKSVHKLQVVH